jgi:hypothetical protein
MNTRIKNFTDWHAMLLHEAQSVVCLWVIHNTKQGKGGGPGI